MGRLQFISFISTYPAFFEITIRFDQIAKIQRRDDGVGEIFTLTGCHHLLNDKASTDRVWTEWMAWMCGSDAVP